MKKYKCYEIYPSEKAAQKIIQHLDVMLDSKPKIYRKTLLRYKALAKLLLQCVAKILKLLEEETLISSCDSEFQELTGDDANELMDQLTDLQSKVTNYSKFVDDKVEQNKNKSEIHRMSTAETLKLYAETIRSGEDVNYGYEEVNVCAELISYWFRMRFSENNPNFRYQIKQLPSWIQYIVISYGKACADGNSKTFVTSFKQWCNSIVEDTNNVWAIPYNIFDIMRKPKGEYFTLQAMIIYDLLLSKHYYLLTDADTDIKPDPLFIADKVKYYHPDLEEPVKKRIAKRSEILELINFHSVEVTE